jgi:hypothetical protein
MSRGSKVRASAERAIEQMTPVLRAQYDELLEVLAAAASNEVAARYRAGRIVREIKSDENKYGSSAVVLLATALGRSASSLYRYARVAECWDAVAIDGLMRRRSATGEPLSWSHLIFLARVEDAERRAALVERAVAEALSVREIGRLVGAGTDEDDAPPADDDRDAPASKALRRVVTQAESVRAQAEAWNRVIASAASTRDFCPEDLALVERLLQVHANLTETLSTHLRQLRMAKARVVVAMRAEPSAARFAPSYAAQ